MSLLLEKALLVRDSRNYSKFETSLLRMKMKLLHYDVRIYFWTLFC